jgi:hypothetical protein
MFPGGERLWGEGNARRDRATEDGMPHLVTKTLTIATIALTLGGVPAIARAGVLASGYLGSSNAYRFGCRVLNVGTEPVVITSAKVILDTGSPLTDFDDCTQKTLDPGQKCGFSGPGDTMAGIVKVAGGTKRLRGVCVLLAPGNVVLSSVEMR